MTDARDRAFTLLELLAVLTLLAILMGIGVGAFRKINLGRALAVAQVKDQLRAAQLFAREQATTARVDLDAVNNRVVASGPISVGDWHFEDDVSRGWPQPARLEGGARVVPGGAIGKCLEFPASDPGVARLGTSPAFDSDTGLRIEAFVRLEAESVGDLVSKGDAYALSIGPGRLLKAFVGVGAGRSTARVVAECQVALPADRWVRVGMSYDGHALVLYRDGMEVTRVEDQTLQPPRPDPDHDVVVGSAKPRFIGWIDEVKLANVVTQAAPDLPEGVRLAAAGTVYFDGRGRLDPRYHSKPVVITLLYDEGQRSREVSVSLLGEVQ